jgi:carbamoyl-phosphate synthase large subunit
VYDGTDILVPGIFEHVERAGIHSGDSISVYPPQTIDAAMQERIFEVTRSIAHELQTRGLINIQFVIHQGELYIIEANPRASRTVPIISKATGINLVAAATRVALGEKLADMPYGTGLLPDAPFVVVKVPVFSFAKMRGVETILGPEMKSTGEVLGIDATFAGALRKGFIAAGIRVPAPAADGSCGSRILVSISDEDKAEAVPILRDYAALGYTLIATRGTHALLAANGIASEPIKKIADGSPNVLDTIVSRSVDLVINAGSPRDQNDGYRIRRAAVESSVACLTSLDTARALASALGSTAGPPRSLQDYRATVFARE